MYVYQYIYMYMYSVQYRCVRYTTILNIWHLYPAFNLHMHVHVHACVVHVHACVPRLGFTCDSGVVISFLNPIEPLLLTS